MTQQSVLDDLRGHFETCGLPAHQRPEVECLTWGESGATDPGERVVRVAVEAYEREFGTSPAVRGELAATDGWWFTNRAGIPTVMALGPGSVADAHVVDEHVEVDDLVRHARLYADLIARYLLDDRP
jgi:acetylornithine deacetylase/succinyl-diaminopimelate desuccinylase-like protein